MYDKDFRLEHLTSTILAVKPQTVTLSAHHYIQLSESTDLAGQEDNLTSVRILFPAGSSVPSSCQPKLMKTFRGVIVSVVDFYDDGRGYQKCGIKVCETLQHN